MRNWIETRLQPIQAHLRRQSAFGSAEYRLRIYDRWSALTKDGLELYRMLVDSGKRLSRRRSGKAVMFTDMAAQMKEGKSFAQALARWAPPEEVIPIEAAERAGRVDMGLEQSYLSLEARGEITKALLSAAVYPALLIAVLIGMLAGFSYGMVPLLASFQPPSSWQGSAQTLYQLSQFIVHYGLYVLGGGGVVAIWVVWSLGNAVGAWRDRVNMLPPWNMYQVQQSAILLVSVAAMLKAGISLFDALGLVGKNARPWVARHIREMRRRMTAGDTVAEVLDSPLFDTATRDDLSDYGRLPSMDEAISKLGERVRKQSVLRVQRQASLSNAILFVVVFLCAIWIITAFFGLILNLVSSVSAG